MQIDELRQNIIVQGPIFPEPVQISMTQQMGEAVKIIGKGLRTGQFYDPILSIEQVAKLEASPEKEPFDGDPVKFRLGIEALRLGLAYEYDPYFSLSIARIDPLPHQLEAVYDYFLSLPRIRFLLADDGLPILSLFHLGDCHKIWSGLNVSGLKLCWAFLDQLFWQDSLVAP